MNLRDLPHLGRRFLGSLRARRTTPAEQLWVAAHLEGEPARLFFAQCAMDQRHALDTALRLQRDYPERRDLGRAALLHDVGKTPSGLGVAGRSVASLLAIAHLRAPRRMAQYLDHGRVGAAALRAAGEGPLPLAFAEFHHDPQVPPGIAAHDWKALRAADAE